MLSTSLYPLFAFFGSTLLAKPAQAVSDQTLQSHIGNDLRPASPPSSTLSSSNATLSLVDASSLKDASIECDGQEYGFKPDAKDCGSALRHQMTGRKMVRFGQRGTPSEEEFIALPYRLMGDQARCYLQPVLLNLAEFGSASLSQIREATSDLVLSCASRAEQGGIATNIGGDNNVGLVLGTYKPDIECRGDFPNWVSCVNVMKGMPASKDTLLFGPEADPDAQVVVPHFIESDDKKCLTRIWYTKKESDNASWYDIWEAITAVYSVCLRKGKRGTIRGLGDAGNLFLTLTPQVSSMGNISLDGTTYTGENQGASDS